MASQPSLITRDIAHMIKPSGNVYETIVVISKRARQISSRTREELSNKLSDFASTVDNLEEVFENREQIEISKYYERLPKASTLATDEFLDGKLNYTRPQAEEVIVPDNLDD